MAEKRLSPYTRYPVSSLINYNGNTVLHYLLGGAGIMLGYDSRAGFIFGLLYLIFAFLQMYVLMPLKVCPNCVYHRLENSRCISGLNVISRKLFKEGRIQDFPKRSQGVFCPNNQYLAALVIPIVAMIPALILSFSFAVLGILLAAAGLLIFRFFVVFTRIACGRCRAKNVCPNAQAMGLAVKTSNIQ